VETFVVRVFVPAGDEQLELTGFVEHAGREHSESFAGAAGLIGALLHELERDRRQAARKPEGEEKA